ncbi:MAG: MarR family winged helix-turn-helix transcriptional regulator [Mangrovicoccus sp.]
MTFERNKSAGYLVNHLARLLARGLQRRIKPLGLSTGTFPVLLALWEKDGQSQRDLVVLLGLEQATMANTLTRMQRDGLITRRPDPIDGRKQRIWLTELAKGLEFKATQEALLENTEALACLDPDEKETFIATMTKVISALETRDEALNSPQSPRS